MCLLERHAPIAVPQKHSNALVRNLVLISSPPPQLTPPTHSQYGYKFKITTTTTSSSFFVLLVRRRKRCVRTDVTLQRTHTHSSQ